MSINNLTKKQMRIALNMFLTHNIYLSPCEIKQLKILRRDDLTYEFSKTYAIQYIKSLLTKVKITHQDKYLDDNLDPYCDWEELFDSELEKMSKYALIMTEKRRHEVSIFEIIEYLLNAFLDFIYEEVLY